MDNTQEFTCLSLCSGYGGLELGLKRACPNIRTVAYVEVEAFAVANLVSKMEKGLLDVAPVWTDIKTFDGRPFCGKVDIVTAGYPCQPFSVAGKRKGTDDPRHLWPHIERILEAVRPVWFFGENVSGHLTIGFPEVYRSLRNMGYTVEAGLFTAAECGAPHRRERLFILAKSLQQWRGWCENLGEHTRRPKPENKTSRPSKSGNTEPNGLSAPTLKEGIRQTVPNDTQRQDTTSELEGTDIARELADTTTEGLHKGNISQERQIARQSWPAQPGQPQYEWEEPRVVVNTLQGNNRAGKLGQSRQGANKRLECNGKEAQPRLGRTVDGTKCRVDRLRLLGNGVVPQQAERALRYLLRKNKKRNSLKPPDSWR